MTDPFPLAEILRCYLNEIRAEPLSRIDALLRKDFIAAGRNDLPKWLRHEGEKVVAARPLKGTHLPKRQALRTGNLS